MFIYYLSSNPCVLLAIALLPHYIVSYKPQCCMCKTLFFSSNPICGKNIGVICFLLSQTGLAHFTKVTKYKMIIMNNFSVTGHLKQVVS